MTTEFAQIAFRDAAGAEAALNRLAGEDRGQLRAFLLQALRESPDPDLALVRLERFLAASVTPQAELELMGASLRYTAMLLTLVGQSHYLTDILCRNPEFMSWLWDEAELDRARPRNDFVEDALRSVRTFETFAARQQALRRFKRRETLRIAARDLFIHAPLVSVLEDLTNLADAAIECAVWCAHEELRGRYGTPLEHSGETARFVVLGMGKLGGRELNFSSDIDLIFLYSDAGETSGGASGVANNTEYFHKLGERIIAMLAEATSEGTVFRVDMRLRPHGRMAPLAVDLETAVLYYEREGHAWERQALIKARPVAGDLALGELFIERTRPFVYPRYFDDETLEDIWNIKRQMEAQIANQGQTHTEVKLGHGGIRDIEFTVQLLQLLNGGKEAGLRLRGTLEAIDALGRHGLLRPFDATTLASNYTFLRQVEHRLQLEGSQQRHALPTDPAALETFARRLGYATADSFLNDYRDRARETRAILDQFMAREGSGKLWLTDLFNVQSDGGAGLEGLRRTGFTQPETARRELLELYAGPEQRPYSLRVRQQFFRAAPNLLEALGKTERPDDTLRRLGQIITRIGAPAPIYDLLGTQPGLCAQLATLAETSPYLAEMLIREPGLFDVFGRSSALAEASTRTDLESQLADYEGALEPEAAPYRLKIGETLRIGLRDVLKGVDVLSIGRELSLLADVCLTHALRAALKHTNERFGASATPETSRFAVLALGKLGGREMGYGSDLDLVFVYDSSAPPPGPTSSIEYFTALAATIIRLLKEPTRHGTLYDVDARLRPDGKKGSLVVTDARLAEYYEHEAQAWERLALIKARLVCGDEAFGRRAEAIARDAAFGRALTVENVANIENVRQKIVESAGPDDLKKAEGGIAELEFGVRLLQIANAARAPELRRGDVPGALEALQNIGAIEAETAGSLREAYVLYRRVENRLRLVHGRATSTIPADPSERDHLARQMGLQGDLIECLTAHKRRVHAFYQAAVHSLGV